MSSRAKSSLWNIGRRKSHGLHDSLGRRRLGFESLEHRRVLATLWVDPNVPPSGNIFSKINDAVAAAHSGDTVKVVAGTYLESVNVNKPGLKIIGGQVRASGEPLGPSLVLIDGGTGFALTSNNITVKNFTIRKALIAIATGSAFSGFNILHNTFASDAIGIALNTTLIAPVTTTISGNLFTNNGGDGVVSQRSILAGLGARNVTITGNTFQSQNTDAAIRITGMSPSTNVQILANRVMADAGFVVANVKNSKIDGNTIVDPTQIGIKLGGAVTNSEVNNNTLIQTASLVTAGIALDQTLVPIVNVGNRITGNTISSVDPTVMSFSSGISSHDTNQNTISKNTVTGSVIGIDVQFGGSHMVLSNVVARNEYGIQLNHVAGSTISNNIVNSNAVLGITMTNITGNVIFQNTVNSNGGGIHGGIEAISCNQNKLTGNIANFNGTNGFSFVSSANNVFAGNTANFNGRSGFNLSSSTSTMNKFSGNTANQNQQSGFFLNSLSHDNTLSGNTAKNNILHGFSVLGGASSNTLNKNIAKGNLNDGFMIAANGNKLSFNTASGNGANGILLMSASSNVVMGNTLLNNRFNGLRFFGSSDNMALGNIIKDNQFSGISLVSTSSNNTISNNMVLGNTGDGIVLADSASGNTISGNTAMGNADAVGGFDLIDLSLGSGTAGTANTWLNNKALRRPPAGLL